MPATLLSVPEATPRPLDTELGSFPTGSSTPTKTRVGLASLLRRPIAALLALLTAVLTAYAPSLNGQFLWDDTALVLHNLFIRSPLFCLEVFRHTLFNGDSNFFRPTQTLVFIADYWFWGLDPFGYHLTNIFIHAANAFLLYLVLRRVLPTLVSECTATDANPPLLAFAVALVWALHPIHSAAVAYVSGSADSLAMLFCLSAWLACERALAAHALPRLGWAAMASIALLFGLCSKEIAFVWLLIFTGWLFGLRRGGNEPPRPLDHRGSVRRRPCWRTQVCVICRPLRPRRLPSRRCPRRACSCSARWATTADCCSSRTSFSWSARSSPRRGLANPEDASVYFALATAGVGMLAAFAAGAFWPGRGRNLRRFGAGWFLLGFLPISNLFSLNATVAEHWLYLPSIGFLLFLTGVALDLPLAMPPRRAAALGATVVLLAASALGVRTWYRTFDWSDEITFFRQTIADGGDVPRARAGLAAAYSRQHDDAHAIAVLRAVVSKYPNVLANRINLANALGRQGQTAEAKTLLEKTAADLFARDGDPREVVAVIHSLDRLEGGDPAWNPHPPRFAGHRHAASSRFLGTRATRRPGRRNHPRPRPCAHACPRFCPRALVARAFLVCRRLR